MRSIDEVEAALQRQGYIAALTNPKVVQAIQSGADRADVRRVGRRRPAELARDDAVAAGITINGLPILNDRAIAGDPATAARIPAQADQGPSSYIPARAVTPRPIARASDRPSGRPRSQVNLVRIYGVCRLPLATAHH